jgi:hypothetical protein
MDSFSKISLHSRLWIAALAAAALSIGTWSIAPAPANAGVAIGVGIPFPGLYAQYPYYAYPPPAYDTDLGRFLETSVGSISCPQ